MNTITRRSPSPGSKPPSWVSFGVIGALLAVLLIGAGSMTWLNSGQGGAGIGGPFRLEDGTGKTEPIRIFAAKYMLVYFGYTSCPDVCPTTLNAVSDAIDKSSGPVASKIRPVFITVDPKREHNRRGEAVCGGLRHSDHGPDRHARRNCKGDKSSTGCIMPTIAPGQDQTTTRWITVRSFT